MSQKRINVVTAGIILSLFLASMEGTVVATAMPSIVAQLGGLSIYSWVFAIYMLASTTTVPIYGKVSDLFGRKKIYAFSMGLFLVGSILCGLSNSMETLIIFRAIQGLGAGGIIPMALTSIGELYDVEKRAKMQGVISSVWGISSIIGPLIGGFLVDQISWHWVFLINLIPGSLAILIVWFVWIEPKPEKHQNVKLDIPGTVLLTLSILALLLGLNDLENSGSIWFVLFAVAAFIALILVEKKAVDPVIPLTLFRNKLFVIAFLHGIFAGWAMFGSLSYIPLFVQAVIGTTATLAGIALTPMSIVWAISSALGGRLIIKTNFRLLAIVGMVFLVIGSYLMTTIGLHTSYITVMFYTSLMGFGMGFTIPVFMTIIQTAVSKSVMGTATSTIQFSRNIGGTIGVSILGVFLSTNLSKLLVKSGFNINTISLRDLINPESVTQAVISEPLRNALSQAMANMFYLALIAAALGFVVVLFTPHGKVTQLNSASIEKKMEPVEVKEIG